MRMPSTVSAGTSGRGGGAGADVGALAASCGVTGWSGVGVVADAVEPDAAGCAGAGLVAAVVGELAGAEAVLWSLVAGCVDAGVLAGGFSGFEEFLWQPAINATASKSVICGICLICISFS
jgi:hypothetical protein